MFLIRHNIWSIFNPCLADSLRTFFLLFVIITHCLTVEYRVPYLRGVNKQQRIYGDTHQIWIWFKHSHKVYTGEISWTAYYPPPLVQKQIFHDDVIKWQHFPRYWPFVRGIHRWPVNSPHKGQWRRALMFFYLRLNKQLSKQSWCWWFETPSRPL